LSVQVFGNMVLTNEGRLGVSGEINIFGVLEAGGNTTGDRGILNLGSAAVSGSGVFINKEGGQIVIKTDPTGGVCSGVSRRAIPAVTGTTVFTTPFVNMGVFAVEAGSEVRFESQVNFTAAPLASFNVDSGALATFAGTATVHQYSIVVVNGGLVSSAAWTVYGDTLLVASGGEARFGGALAVQPAANLTVQGAGSIVVLLVPLELAGSLIAQDGGFLNVTQTLTVAVGGFASVQSGGVIFVEPSASFTLRQTLMVGRLRAPSHPDSIFTNSY
jgi:hypothetical protein